MDFNKIFSSYTHNTNDSTSQRSNILSEDKTLPQDILSGLVDFLNNYNSNKKDTNQLSNDNQSNNDLESSTTPQDSNNPEPPANNDIPQDILNALSQLDTPPEDEPPSQDNEDDLSENNNLDDILNNLDDNLDLEDISSTIEDEFNTENNNLDDILNNLDDDTFNDSIEALNFPNTDSIDDDDDISDFLSSLSDEDPSDINFEEDDSSMWSEEVESPLLSDDNDEFDIEIPKEFNTTPTDDFSEEEIEEQDDISDNLEDSMLPDFNNTEYSPDNSINDFDDNLEDDSEPLEFESIDEGVNFDTWSQNSSTPTHTSQITLSQDQIFKIRSKINHLSNKNLRFQIREIIADPEVYHNYYDELISMLLIGASEDSIQKLLETSEHLNDTETYTHADISTTKPSFFADDVASYQESIDRLKNEFIYNLKKYSLYGLIILLSGTIAWLGVAQPMQVNSIYQKGLVKVQEDNFIDGEALFQQAVSITGTPDTSWLVKYANVYHNKSIVKEASKKYHLALAIEPHNTNIAIQASDFYTNLGQEFYSNAIQIMENNTKYHPKKFEPWDYLGSLYIDYSDFFIDDRNKQTDILYSAADIYQKFILNNPKNTAPYYRMIDIYIRIGNREQIDKIYRLISDLKPKYVNLDIINKLSKYYIDQRALNNASTLFKTTVPLLDNYSRNIKELQKIMDQYYNIAPDQISNILSESYYEFARYQMLSFDIKKSAQLLTNAIIFNPNHSDAYNLLGENYLQSSHITDTTLQNADDLFNKSLNINPNNYKPHINLGHLNYFWDTELGDIDKAHKTALFHYNVAKSMMPSHVKNELLSYNHGWLLYQNKDYRDAIESWSDIYKATPDNPVLSYALGSALFNINNPQLAQVEFTKTINLFEHIREAIPVPDLNQKRHREVYTQLAKAYNNLGVINANYAKANPNRTDYLSSQALLNFYNAQNLSDQMNTIYSTTEYNIGVLTRSQIRNRDTIFDDNIPKQTSIENSKSTFNKLLLQDI